MGVVGTWFRERFPLSGDQLRELTNEPVPNHLKRWWFCLGGTPAYLFVVQIVTGVLLAFYYQPAPQTAYESVRYITEEAAFGWYIRGLHKWAATLMIAAVILLLAIVAAITLTMRKRPGLKVQDISKQVAVRAKDRIRIVKMEAEKKK